MSFEDYQPLSRSKQSSALKVKLAGNKAKSKSKGYKGGQVGRHWAKYTEKEIATVKTMWPDRANTIKSIADMLDVSPTKVIHIAESLDLPKRSQKQINTSTLTNEQIEEMVAYRDLTPEKVIDAIIATRGKLGLIQLGDALRKYCYSKTH